MGQEEFEFETAAPVPLKDGDIVALMTDGVSDALGLGRVRELLSGRGDGRALAASVIAACERAFCDDNASVVVAKIRL
jgi:serine/threonine protein phosphatase PrpC